MATQTPCALCQRDFDVPKDAIENASSSFFLTANDQLELKAIKERSFQRNLRVFLYIKRSIKNYTLNSADELKQILHHGRPVDIVRNEDEKQRSFFSGLLTRYNWTTTDRTDDPKFSAPYAGEKTIIRTMPDRNANINDLVWVIKRAHKNKTGLSAFFLHKKHLVWVAIPQPPDRDEHLQQVADRDIGVLLTELKKLFFFRMNFRKINELMLGTGAINYFKYAKSSVQPQPLVLTATGPTCSLCEKAFPIPTSATLNKVVENDATEYYLTAGDLAALTTIKHDSFQKGVMRLGFLTRVTSNLSSSRELAGRIEQGNVREVTEPTKGLTRVVAERVEAVTSVVTAPVRAVRTMYNEPITALKGVVMEPIKAFQRVITYYRSSDIDDLMDHHNGESVLFRTMPDRPANIRHVAWLIEKAHEQKVEINAFFLHKRHFLWVKVVRPPQHNNSPDATRSNNLARLVLKDLRDNFTLRKKTVAAINQKLVGIARVAYHKYPDRTWVDSVTEAVADNKVMILSVGGVLLLVGGYYISRAGQAAPQDARATSDAPPEEPRTQSDAPTENEQPEPPPADMLGVGTENEQPEAPPADMLGAGTEPQDVKCFWNGNFGRHETPDGSICRPPEMAALRGPAATTPIPTPGFVAPTAAPMALPTPY